MDTDSRRTRAETDRGDCAAALSLPLPAGTIEPHRRARRVQVAAVLLVLLSAALASPALCQLPDPGQSHFCRVTMLR